MAANPERHFKPIAATDFRVVHLLPGTFDEDIQCVLETRPSTVKTRYEAISYQWGDDSVKKPILLAHHSPQSRSTNSAGTSSWLNSYSVSLRSSRAFKTLETAVHRHQTPIAAVKWIFGTYLFWRCLYPLPLDAPHWISWLVPRDWWILLICMLVGKGITDTPLNSLKLVLEVAKTKPWLLAGSFSINRRDKLEFERLQVAASLELALRYLRFEKRPRTLWVDGLCINQADEAEKNLQIVRMDSIYANASQVVVWLGGYHGITDTGACQALPSQDGRYCVHRRQIESAFYFIRTVSGWRLLVPYYWRRSKKTHREQGLPGLRDMSRRGWWKRLWVVQEVALATGRVQIQCGHNMCEYGNFRSGHITAIRHYRKDAKVQADFRPADRFGDMVKFFGYCEFLDRENETAKMCAKGLTYVCRTLFRGDTSLDEQRFHEEAFAQRLQHVLLRTAGRFQCREDKDRLNAVLGIAGGARTGKATLMAGFVRMISSHSTAMIVVKNMEPLSKYYTSLRSKIVFYTITTLYSFLPIFYEEAAKYWTINRPEYVVTGHEERREVMDAVTGGSGKLRSRAEFFTALARYLAQSTKSLAFLDAASCGQDVDAAMPSWVPSWTRKVAEPAYKFAARGDKEEQAVDSFRFVEGGTALELLGWSCGRVDVVRLTSSRTSSQLDAFEKWLALPTPGRKAIVHALLAIHEISNRRDDPSSTMPQSDRKALISQISLLIKTALNVGGILLSAGGTTYIYSLKNLALGIGFLRAGEVAKGDRLVRVPGCFYHLVLRKQTQIPLTGLRWKLMGLVEMGSITTKREPFSVTKWNQLCKDKAINKYTVV